MRAMYLITAVADTADLHTDGLQVLPDSADRVVALRRIWHIVNSKRYIAQSVVAMAQWEGFGNYISCSQGPDEVGR